MCVWVLVEGLIKVCVRLWGSVSIFSKESF